jgi:hypothetical protein
MEEVDDRDKSALFEGGATSRRSTSLLGNHMDPRIQYLLAVAPTVLLLTIMVIGIAIAILYRRQWPWTARLVIPGLVALAANVIGSIAVRSYARRLSFAIYEDASIVAHHLAVLHSVLFALNYIGIALITAAVFAERGVIRIGRVTIGSSDRGARLR